MQLALSISLYQLHRWYCASILLPPLYKSQNIFGCRLSSIICYVLETNNFCRKKNRSIIIVTSVPVYTASRMSNIRGEAKCERALVHIVYLHHMATCYRILNFYGGGGHVKVVSQSVEFVKHFVCWLPTTTLTCYLTVWLSVSLTRSVAYIVGVERNATHRIVSVLCQHCKRDKHF